jgi:hypothetical protein
MKVIGLSLLMGLGVVSLACRGFAGLPGYVEWILWEETDDTQTGTRTFQWVVGPYPKPVDCERDRDRLAFSARRHGGNVATRFLCVPDTVDPRADPRWQ